LSEEFWLARAVPADRARAATATVERMRVFMGLLRLRRVALVVAR
jgi:hypothetical protein